MKALRQREWWVLKLIQGNVSFRKGRKEHGAVGWAVPGDPERWRLGRAEPRVLVQEYGFLSRKQQVAIRGGMVVTWSG